MDKAWGGSSGRLDEKHRLLIPARAREDFPAMTHLIPAPDNCLFLFSAPQFARYRKRLMRAEPTNLPGIAYDRILNNRMVSQRLDRQGRIVVPAKLREYASINRDVVVNWMETRIEIWDTQCWDDYVARYIDDYAKSSEGVR
ncbi:MAG: hypothetical protein LBD97_09860 [Bifidobacteriaceae bacterium]|nr:hypothetical protein [Bifidobacteriaceae bacterium]